MLSKHDVKLIKKVNNFDKFRKEVKSLCKQHYRAKLSEAETELKKALKHMKLQDKQQLN